MNLLPVFILPIRHQGHAVLELKETLREKKLIQRFSYPAINCPFCKTCSASFGMEIVLPRQYPAVWGFILTDCLLPPLAVFLPLTGVPPPPDCLLPPLAVFLPLTGVPPPPVFLGLWSQQISAEVSIVPLPNSPGVGENVLLSVGGVTGNILYFNWYRGKTTASAYGILSYVPSSSTETINRPAWVGRVRGFPNGSMELSGVIRGDSGIYTVQIQTQLGGQQQASVNIKIYASSTEQLNRTLQIAVGAAIGAVLGAVLLITAAVLLYKKYGNCQGIKNDDRVNMYEVPDMSGAPTHMYQNIILHNPGGPHVNTPNPKAPDSTYTDLLFGHQSVYDQLKR